MIRNTGFYFVESRGKISILNIKLLQDLVTKLLGHDMTGHGMDHIQRVLLLSTQFAKELGANQDKVALIALLHDVDDYKLVGIDQSKANTNSLHIMNQANIPVLLQREVIGEIQSIGYSKYLEGIRPTSIEGKIVSDADMCDALGANGLMRVQAYGLAKKQPFFHRDIFPKQMEDAHQYRQFGSKYTIHHFFDKLLLLKSLMLTEPGKKVAETRHQFLIEFLQRFFIEENAQDWLAYLHQFLMQNQS